MLQKQPEKCLAGQVFGVQCVLAGGGGKGSRGEGNGENLVVFVTHFILY